MRIADDQPGARRTTLAQTSQHAVQVWSLRRPRTIRPVAAALSNRNYTTPMGLPGDQCAQGIASRLVVREPRPGEVSVQSVITAAI